MFKPPFTQVISKKNALLMLIILTGLVSLSMHIPFLKADPDINVSESRDANTDEGLNSCQIRNLVNHGKVTLKKSDNLIKTPLFGIILFAPLKLLGTKQVIGRLTILIFSLAICYFIFLYNSFYNVFGLCSFVFILCQFFVFHYFHYCMAEMLSTSLIFLAIFFLTKPYKENSALKASALSATCISLAYYIKIQFLYDIVILPMAIVLFIIFGLFNRKLLTKQLIQTVSFLGIYLAIYFFIWYWPNKNFFQYVMADQTLNRFVSIGELFTEIKFNINKIFYTPYLKSFTILFYFSFIVGGVKVYFSESRIYKLLFVCFTTWIFIEVHKLTMTYLPTRYLISIFFVMGLMIALVITETLVNNIRKAPVVIAKVLAIALLFSFGFKDLSDYYRSYKNRTYNISNINIYLSRYQFGTKPVIGAWAPSLSWNCKAITYPVWKDYFNDIDVIKTQHPAVIISEVNEEDSGSAFSSRGINLDGYADSIKFFPVNHWKLKLLWIKPTAN